MLAAPLAAAADPMTSAFWFVGTWVCSGTEPGANGAAPISYHTVNAFSKAPGGRWLINRWGAQTDASGGVAYIGYVSALKQWDYDDYHYDGGLALVTSPGLEDGRWIWTGPYFTPDGHELHGRIVYAIRSHDRYDRIFEAPDGGGWQRLGGDSCARR
jgi:hypothetical protein